MSGDVRLTEAERAVMARPGVPVEESCERIVADRLAAEREHIAQAIEAARPSPVRDQEPGDWKRGERHGRLHAARIARNPA